MIFGMHSGFSLLELSIVLVIVGLLAGGVMTGQSLIRAAEMRAVTTEYQRYNTAMNGFRDKYNAIPGDMRNATQFWGQAATCPGTSAEPSVTVTCNGDGDARIWVGAATANEYFRAWQHMANAGVIEGTYTGVANTTTASHASALAGSNVPISKMPNAGWKFYGSYPMVFINDGVLFEGSYPNMLVLGVMDGTTTTGKALKTEEAWNIDSKLDDGKPGTGIVRTPEDHNSCHDAGTSNGVALAGIAKYRLNSTEANACYLYFNTIFQ